MSQPSCMRAACVTILFIGYFTAHTVAAWRVALSRTVRSTLVTCASGASTVVLRRLGFSCVITAAVCDLALCYLASQVHILLFAAAASRA